MSMVLKLLAESVRQTGIAPHPHPHRKIAAFHERRTDVFRIGLAAQHPGTASDAGCGAITRFRAVSGVAVQCRPRPNAAKATLYLFQGQILILTVNKRPYLIALQPTNAHVADMRVMVSSASTPQIVQESENGVFADAQHPARSVDGIAF